MSEVEARAPVRELSEREFSLFRDLLHQAAGIHLSAAKKALVCGRLGKRLRHHGLQSYADYYRLIAGERSAERQIAIDLLTTNETYFFREPRHFEFLRERLLGAHRGEGPFRVWSAACSSGEEPYSVAMLLADVLGARPWEVVASDLSTRMLERARSGLYAIERARDIPAAYLKAYCRKGIGSQEGTLLVDAALRARVSFRQVNLNQALPPLGAFDLILLRNVMIYFDLPTKRRVVERLVPMLKPGAHLFVGHSESLNGVTDALRPVCPSVYRRG